MRLLKIGFFILIIFIFVFSTTIFGLNQQDTQSRIQEIESLLDNTLSIWKIKKGDVVDGEKIMLDDSNWNLIKTGFSFQDKIFWPRQHFQLPENFA